MAININHKAGASHSAKESASVPNQGPTGPASPEKSKHLNRETSDILSVSASFQAKVKSLDQLKSQPPQEENPAIDGELQRMGDMLARMKTLSVQAKTIPMNPGQQEQLSSEFAQLKQEIQRYSNATRQKGISIPYDPNQEHTAPAASTQENNAWVQSLVLEDQQSVESAITTLDSTIEQLALRSSALNGIQDRLTSAFTAIASHDPRDSNPVDRIQDPAQAQKISHQLRENISEHAQESYAAQANQDAKTTLALLR